MVLEIVTAVAGVSAPVATALGGYNLVRYMGIRAIKKARELKKQRERDKKQDELLSGLDYVYDVVNSVRTDLAAGEASEEAEQVAAFVQKLLAKKKAKDAAEAVTA